MSHEAELEILEEKLTNPKRVLTSFMPVFGPIYAAVTGIAANYKHRHAVREERNLQNQIIDDFYHEEADYFHAAGIPIPLNNRYRNKFDHTHEDGSGHVYDGCDVREYTPTEQELASILFEQKYGASEREIKEKYGYQVMNELRSETQREATSDGFNIDPYLGELDQRLKEKDRESQGSQPSSTPYESSSNTSNQEAEEPVVVYMTPEEILDRYGTETQRRQYAAAQNQSQQTGGQRNQGQTQRWGNPWTTASTSAAPQYTSENQEKYEDQSRPRPRRKRKARRNRRSTQTTQNEDLETKVNNGNDTQIDQETSQYAQTGGFGFGNGGIYDDGRDTSVFGGKKKRYTDSKRTDQEKESPGTANYEFTNQEGETVYSAEDLEQNPNVGTTAQTGGMDPFYVDEEGNTSSLETQANTETRSNYDTNAKGSQSNDTEEDSDTQEQKPRVSRTATLEDALNNGKVRLGPEMGKSFEVDEEGNMYEMWIPGGVYHATKDKAHLNPQTEKHYFLGRYNHDTGKISYTSEDREMVSKNLNRDDIPLELKDSVLEFMNHPNPGNPFDLKGGEYFEGLDQKITFGEEESIPSRARYTKKDIAFIAGDEIGIKTGPQNGIVYRQKEDGKMWLVNYVDFPKYLEDRKQKVFTTDPDVPEATIFDESLLPPEQRTQQPRKKRWWQFW